MENINIETQEKQYEPIVLSLEDIQMIYQAKDGDELKTIPSHHHFEAVLDPWHKDAFEGTPAKGLGNSGKRKYHLYSVDWCGNLIADYGALPDHWRQLRKAHLN